MLPRSASPSMVVSSPALFVDPILVEYIGRRLSMIIGYLGMMTCMLICAATSSGGNHSANVRNTNIAFLVIFEFVYVAFTSSAHWAVSAKTHAVRYPAVGQAFAMVVTNIFIFGTNFWSRYMISPEYGNIDTMLANSTSVSRQSR